MTTPERISKSQRDRYERERAEQQRLRSELHRFALWISPVWDEENEDDVKAALRAVDAFKGERVTTQVEARLIEANLEAQRSADRWMQRAQKAEAEVERLRETADYYRTGLEEMREARDRLAGRDKSIADVLDNVLRSMEETGEFDPVDDGGVIRNVIEALSLPVREDAE